MHGSILRLLVGIMIFSRVSFQLSGLWRGEDNGEDSNGNFPSGFFSNGSFVAGVNGHCFNFTGSDDSFFDTGIINHFDFLANSNFTVSFWVYARPPALPMQTSFISKSVLGSGWAVMFVVHDSNSWDVSFATPGFPGPTSNSWLPMGVWTHVIVTRLNGELKFYFNGALSFNTSGFVLNGSSTSPLTFGATYHYPCLGYCHSTTALLDEVFVSDEGVNDSEAASLAAQLNSNILPQDSPTPSEDVLSSYNLCNGSLVDNTGAIGASPLCKPVGTIDPLITTDAATFLAGSTDKYGNILLPASVCELNPQGYRCTNFSNSNCSCTTYTEGINGTGRSPFATRLDLVDANGTVIDKSLCPYSTWTDSSCVAGCATSYLRIPFTVSLSDCGFTFTNVGGKEMFTGQLRVSVTERYQNASGVIVSRIASTVGVYTIKSPSSLLVSRSVTVSDGRVQAQISSCTLEAFNGLGTPTAQISLDLLVQNPYVLSDTAIISISDPGYQAAILAVNRSACSDSEANCLLQYSVALVGPSGCTFESQSYNLTFTYNCTSASIAAGTCPLTQTETTSVIFSFESLNFCPQPLLISISTSSMGLQTFADPTLTIPQQIFFVGTTVYAAAMNFSSTTLDGSPGPEVLGVSLPGFATWTKNAASVTVALQPVGSCSPDLCAFSVVIPTTALPQPEFGSTLNVSLAVVFSVSFSSGGKRMTRKIRKTGLSGTPFLASALVSLKFYSPTPGIATGSGSLLMLSPAILLVFFFLSLL